MKIYTKEELIHDIILLSQQGWHESTKKIINKRNDGAVGNTLESLLDIKENNLPLPNASEWELKGQRSHTTSLVTLKHIEPSPTAVGIVANLLLPNYGWKHKEAGKKYPESEMSFRSTTNAVNYTNRGFKVIVDREQKKVRFVFDYKMVDMTIPEISSWIGGIRSNIGLNPLSPEPYWGFKDLEYRIGSKINNCFYIVADAKVENKHEYFKFIHLNILQGFSFERFIDCLSNGTVLIDFDARTGHNHGTKFRIRQNCWKDLYDEVIQIF